MSRRSNREEFNEAVKDMQRGDLEDVLKVQQHVVGIAMGRGQFEYPNAPRISGQYQPNQTEIDFTRQSQSTMYSNFFRFIVAGSLTPFFTLRVLSIVQKRVITPRRYVMWSSFGAAFGGMYGLTLGRMAASREYIRLENSPLATEARYQLFKINPSHPFLRGFEHEMNEWENYQGQYTENGYTDNNMYDRNASMPQQQQVKRYDNDRNRRSDYSQYSNAQQNEDNDANANRNNKRNRFYQGRNRVHNNYSYNDDVDEDVGDFFEGSQHGIDPKDDVNDFFEGDSRQKWG